MRVSAHQSHLPRACACFGVQVPFFCGFLCSIPCLGGLGCGHRRFVALLTSSKLAQYACLCGNSCTARTGAVSACRSGSCFGLVHWKHHAVRRRQPDRRQASLCDQYHFAVKYNLRVVSFNAVPPHSLAQVCLCPQQVMLYPTAWCWSCRILSNCTPFSPTTTHVAGQTMALSSGAVCTAEIHAAAEAGGVCHVRLVTSRSAFAFAGF